MATKAPGMKIYADTCGYIFDNFSDADLGRVIRDAWGYYQCGTEPTYDKQTEMHLIGAFAVLKAGAEAGNKAYQNKVGNGALNGIIGHLAKCDGWNMKLVQDQIDYHRDKGKSDAEIAEELKEIYKTASQQKAETEEYGLRRW